MVIQAVCLRVKDDAFEFIFVVVVVKRGCFLLKNLMGSTKPCPLPVVWLRRCARIMAIRNL